MPDRCEATASMMRRASATLVAVLTLHGCGAGERDVSTDAATATPDAALTADAALTTDAARDARSERDVPGDAAVDVAEDAQDESPRDGGTRPDAADAGGDGPVHPVPVHPLVQRLAELEDDWPLLRVGTTLRSFSSFDRAGGNRDGFSGDYAALRVADDGSFVIFDAEGPGVLTTLWFTGPREGGAGLDLGTVRFYFDGETSPRIELPWTELFSGNTAPFFAPLVSDRTVSTGGYVSWVPIPYAKHLVITTEHRGRFYGAYYETLRPDASIATFEEPFPVDPLVARWTEVNAGDFSEDLSPVTDDYTHVGPGTLEALQLDLEHEPTLDELRQARVRIWWDSLPGPSVDVPLGSFFGAGLQGADVRALAFTARGGRFESRFPMPFWEGFRIHVVGTAAKIAVRVGPPRYSRDEAGYFFATFVEQRPTSPGTDFEWDIGQSVGRLVGTVLTVEPVDPLVKKWWEGDLRSYAGGLRTPSLHGTGHEDDHFGGWSNTFLSGPFSLTMHGEPASELIDIDGQYNANTTMYRLYAGHDFAGGLSHGTEHGTQNTVPANYSGVAFYYAQPDRALVETDVVMLNDEASRVAHEYAVTRETGPETLTSAFEGRAYQVLVEMAVTSHTGPAGFRVAVDPESTGCLLRRTFDQREGPQAAELRVDGDRLGTWYTAETNATLRWAERDYFLPASAVAGRTTLAVEVEPLEGYAPWSAVEYRVFCIRTQARGGAVR